MHSSKNPPPPMQEEYHKARRQLMLWSGILFAWELIGIDLGELAKNTGSIGLIVKSLRSQQAVPWVIIILVAYFLYRITIEWFHATEDRRMRTASKVDFTVTWVIALIACVLYFWQRLSNVQFADVFDSPASKVGFLTGFTFGDAIINAVLLILPLVNKDFEILLPKLLVRISRGFFKITFIVNFLIMVIAFFVGFSQPKFSLGIFSVLIVFIIYCIPLSITISIGRYLNTENHVDQE